jgi:hypothetical protein
MAEGYIILYRYFPPKRAGKMALYFHINGNGLVFQHLNGWDLGGILDGKINWPPFLLSGKVQ